MTVLIAFREDLTAEMLEYDLPPAEAATLMVDEIGGEHIRAVFDITSGEPVFVMEEDPWHYLERIKDGARAPPNGFTNRPGISGRGAFWTPNAAGRPRRP